nr:MAG TPA: hypothetical protein [Caudoviricetes sp.]
MFETFLSVARIVVDIVLITLLVMDLKEKSLSPFLISS